MKSVKTPKGTSGKEIIDCFQHRHKMPCILYKSRSISVTVSVENSPLNFIVPFERIDEAINKASDIASNIWSGTDYDQQLLDELRHARQLYGDQIDGKHAPKGAQAGRRGIVVSIQYAAAWTYCLLTEWEHCNREIRTMLLCVETHVKKLVPGYASYTRAQRLSLITAFLVDRCFRKERRGQLDTPVESRTKDHNPKSYYTTYIYPRLSWVKKRLAKNPNMFDFAKVEPLSNHTQSEIRPAPNAYLRQVFDVLATFNENTQEVSGTIKS
jgi:hypothetical protein